MSLKYNLFGPSVGYWFTGFNCNSYNSVWLYKRNYLTFPINYSNLLSERFLHIGLKLVLVSSLFGFISLWDILLSDHVKFWQYQYFLFLTSWQNLTPSDSFALFIYVPYWDLSRTWSFSYNHPVYRLRLILNIYSSIIK